MDRGRSLFIFKVKIKFQGHWAFTKNSGTWILVGRIWQELYSLGCSNLVHILNMERGRRLLIFKVKGHISRSLGLYKEFWHLDPCGQDIARTIWPRMLKLSVYFIWTDEEAYLFSRSKVKFQGHLALTKNSGTWILVGTI